MCYSTLECPRGPRGRLAALSANTGQSCSKGKPGRRHLTARPQHARASPCDAHVRMSAGRHHCNFLVSTLSASGPGGHAACRAGGARPRLQVGRHVARGTQLSPGPTWCSGNSGPAGWMRSCSQKGKTVVVMAEHTCAAHACAPGRRRLPQGRLLLGLL